MSATEKIPPAQILGLREICKRFPGVVALDHVSLEIGAGKEVLNVSDRIAVMHEGKITGVLEREHCTEENVMNLAVGKTLSAAKPAVN